MQNDEKNEGRENETDDLALRWISWIYEPERTFQTS